MSELTAMRFVDLMLDVVEEVQPGLRNSRYDITAILTAPLPRDELRLFQPVQQPRDVRDLANEPFADLTAAQARRLGSTQNPQYVVLRRCNAVRFQRALEGMLQNRGRSEDAEVCLLLETPKRPRLLELCLEMRRHT